MKKFALIGAIVAAWVAGGLAGLAPVEGPARAEEKVVFKVVFHINFGDLDRQSHGMRNLGRMLTEVGDLNEGDIEVVCHGAGISLLVKDQTGNGEAIEKFMKAGVRFAACENTMRDKSITKQDLLAGVVTVPSGAVEVVRKQQDGYAYFKP